MKKLKNVISLMRLRGFRLSLFPRLRQTLGDRGNCDFRIDLRPLSTILHHERGMLLEKIEIKLKPKILQYIK
jgi:hypothetical protein